MTDEIAEWSIYEIAEWSISTVEFVNDEPYDYMSPFCCCPYYPIIFSWLDGPVILSDDFNFPSSWMVLVSKMNIDTKSESL